MATQQAPDRTGEKRSLNISAFENSDFPAVIVGPSYFMDVDLPERTINGRTFPARTLRTERAPVVSLRTTLDGEQFRRLSDENLNYQFMLPRHDSVVGIDADEDGVIISTMDLLKAAVEETKAFRAARAETAVTAADDLAI